MILSRSKEFETDDNFAGKGYTLLLKDGKLQLKLVGRLDDWIVVET